MDVLFCFASDEPSLSPAEVAGRLAMNRTTAWRYLQTLAGTGLVRELGEGRFGLGPRIVSLAESYTSQWGDLEALASAALVRLRDRVGETAALHLRQGWSRVTVRQVESRHELHRSYRELGEPISLLAGAPSLAILAALSPAELAAFLDAHVTSREERCRVERDLDAVRQTGYAHSRGSRVAGVASVAAVVRDPSTRHVLGAVNVTGPEDRLREAAVPEVAREVTAAAAWITEKLATGTPGPVREPTDSSPS